MVVWCNDSLVHPYGERICASHQEPLADVELGVVDQEWSFCNVNNMRIHVLYGLISYGRYA